MSTAEATPQPLSNVIPTPANFPISWESPDDAQLFWFRDQLHLPEPITPLDEEFARHVYRGMGVIFERYEIPLRVRSRRFNTYFYWAVAPVDGTPDHLVAQSKRAEATVSQVTTRLAEIWSQEVLPEVKVHLQFWEDFDLAGATTPELLDHLAETVTRHHRVWELHFRVVTPKHVAMSAFDDFYRDLLGNKTAFDAYQLLRGFDNKTLESERALWKLSRQAITRPTVKRILEENDASSVLALLETTADGRDFIAILRVYLDEFGRQCGKPFHFSEPSWIEDPTPAVRTLQHDIGRVDRDPEAELAAMAVERERLVAEVREHLRSESQPVVNQFETLLKAAQEAAVVSEDHNYWIDFRSAYQVRQVLLEFGRRFEAVGALDEPNDVFCLTLDELRETAAALPRIDRRPLVAGRQAELQYFRTVQPPAVLGTLPAEPPPDTPLGRAVGKFLGSPPAVSSNPREVHGNAGSPGSVRGPAKVLRSLSDSSKLRRGDVLVAETTSAPWTQLFATAAAIVTDAGGVLSHCAVVAREYAIPAVVGTGNATTTIRDGDIVEVDGDHGIVRILG
ncbi:MAG: rifampicin phosphotransferase [Bradyrhizobium sp.]|nr:rifampicin phosphotransferase [Bradyrhizobium sp.]